MIDPVDVRAAWKPVMRLWWRFKRPMTLGVRVIAADEQGRVALIRHSYAHGWHLPGGGVERGETAIEAAGREAAEEAGVHPETLSLFGVYSNHASYRGDHVIVFRADSWRAVDPLEGFEIAERGWFSPAGLPDDVTNGTRRRLEEVFAGREVSPHW